VDRNNNISHNIEYPLKFVNNMDNNISCIGQRYIVHRYIVHRYIVHRYIVHRYIGDNNILFVLVLAFVTILLAVFLYLILLEEFLI
jgi:hypothetical protein